MDSIEEMRNKDPARLSFIQLRVDLYGNQPEANEVETKNVLTGDQQNSFGNKTETYFKFKELIVKEF